MSQSYWIEYTVQILQNPPLLPTIVCPAAHGLPAISSWAQCDVSSKPTQENLETEERLFSTSPPYPVRHVSSTQYLLEISPKLVV